MQPSDQQCPVFDRSGTFEVDVDVFPTRYESGQTRYKAYWEARSVHAYPDGVVRIPDELFVGASYDGKQHKIIVKRDNEYLSKTRQTYLRAAAAK